MKVQKVYLIYPLIMTITFHIKYILIFQTKIKNNVTNKLVNAALSYSEAIENMLFSSQTTSTIDKQPSLLTGGTYIY